MVLPYSNQRLHRQAPVPTWNATLVKRQNQDLVIQLQQYTVDTPTQLLTQRVSPPLTEVRNLP